MIGDAKAQHVVVRQAPPAGNSVDVGSAITLLLGNLTAPPSAWKGLPDRLISALLLAPWWMWLVIGLPGGAVRAVVIKKTARPGPQTAEPIA